MVFADGVKRLDIDNLKFTRVPGVTEPLVTTNVGKVNLRETGLSGLDPR